jgi:methionine sulfoxide reductase heme-binding subunit
MSPARAAKSVWWLVFLTSALPFAYACHMALASTGSDPIKAVLEYLGVSALCFLLITLSITPIKRLLGFSWCMRFRRMLGLYALFYAVLHALIYLVLIVDYSAWLTELTKRPYVLMGALSLLILVVLGLTSPKSMMRRLGQRWKKVHRWVYPASVLAWLHMWWQARGGVGEELLYGLVLLLLLALRVRFFELLVRKVTGRVVSK